MESLHAEIDQLEASIAKLSEEITDLTKAVVELDAAMSNATPFKMKRIQRTLRPLHSRVYIDRDLCALHDVAGQL